MKTKEEIIQHLCKEYDYYYSFTVYLRNRIKDLDMNSNLYVILSKTLLDALIKVSTLKDILKFIDENTISDEKRKN